MTKYFLIEDDVDDQEIFCMALEQVDKDAECIISHDGAQALEMLKSGLHGVPDYIFIDVNMPKMNGISCLEEIKKLKELSGARIFMLSTASDKRITDACIALGAKEFIVKPPGLSALVSKLRSVVSLPD